MYGIEDREKGEGRRAKGEGVKECEDCAGGLILFWIGNIAKRLDLNNNGNTKIKSKI